MRPKIQSALHLGRTAWLSLIAFWGRFAPHPLGRAVFVLLMSGPFAYFMASHYEEESFFLRTLYMGQNPYKRAIPEVFEAKVPILRVGTYDGHFYAQMAVDPTLRREDVQYALDYPAYRGRRVFLSWVSWAAGGGDPLRILHVYSLINVLFFFGFLLWFTVRQPMQSLKTWALGASLFWSAGTLFSVWRALTDFPAVMLGVAAIWLAGNRAAPLVLAACSVLTKETMLLSLPGMFKVERRDVRHLKEILLKIGVAVLPFALWMAWLKWGLSLNQSAGYRNFSVIPFQAMAQEWAVHLVAYLDRPEIVSRFRVLPPLALLFQILYMGLRPDIRSMAWRFGFPFAILAVFLGPSVWVDSAAYTRVLLPLTFGFNLYLFERAHGWKFWIPFLAGNLGLWFWAFYAWKLFSVGRMWLWNG